MLKKVDLEKYKRLAGILQTLSGFLFKLCLCIGILATIASIVLVLIPSSSLVIPAGDRNHMSLSLDGMLQFDLHTPLSPDANVKPVLNALLFMAGIAGLLLAPIFRYLQQVLQTVRDNTPFDPQNAERIAAVGKVLVAGSFAIPFAEYIVMKTTVAVLQITQISAHYSISTNMLLTGLLMLLLGGIFRYGSYLQKEYDDTI